MFGPEPTRVNRELVEEPWGGESQGQSCGQTDAQESGAFLSAGGQPKQSQNSERENPRDPFYEDGGGHGGGETEKRHARFQPRVVKERVERGDVAGEQHA